MIYQATALDLLEAVHMDSHLPMMQVRLRVEPALDSKRLQDALTLCMRKIPELAASYNRRRNCFTTLDNCDAAMLVLEGSTFDFTQWDLEKETQIKIMIQAQDPCSLEIGISHILCDGIGACQLIQLLFAYYDGEACPSQNQRALADLPSINTKHKVAKRTKGVAPMLSEAPDPQQTVVLQQGIALSIVKRLAQEQQISVNDLLMGTYLYTLSRSTGQQVITLPCPVNLRAFLKAAPALCVTNFTGGYEVTILDLQQKSWKMVNQELHTILLQERLRNEDLRLISIMNPLSKWLPTGILRRLAKKFYQIPLISYTNLGRLDPYLHLQQHQIKEALIITSPRSYPAYQLSVSSFSNTCTLTMHIKGNAHQIQQAQLLLDDIAEALHHHAAML